LSAIETVNFLTLQKIRKLQSGNTTERIKGQMVTNSKYIALVRITSKLKVKTDDEGAMTKTLMSY